MKVSSLITAVRAHTVVLNQPELYFRTKLLNIYGCMQSVLVLVFS